ncbi:hypothetical protein BACI349Y_560131 [Bacillus sp. 349Y]|nr:hypothetical protein BACI349Y_560131 [Bacillus sp. 349Y]
MLKSSILLEEKLYENMNIPYIPAAEFDTCRNLALILFYITSIRFHGPALFTIKAGWDF